MTALDLLHLFDAVYLLAMAVWVGGQVFFVAGVAPLVFRVLPAEMAGRFLRALFPRYFALGAIAGAVALPSVVCGALAVHEYRGPAVGVKAGLIVAGILINLYCGNVLTPRINAARDAGESEQARFARLHRRSVRLNAVVLVIGVVLLVWHAYRAAPRTTGIQERSSREPARRLRAEWRVTGQLS